MGGLEERSTRLREHACPRVLLGERVESDGPLLQRLALELDTVPEDALDGRAVHVSREQRRRLYSYPPPSRVRGSLASEVGTAVPEPRGARRDGQGPSPAGTVKDGRACPRLPRTRRPRRGRRHPVAGVRGVASLRTKGDDHGPLRARLAAPRAQLRRIGDDRRVDRPLHALPRRLPQPRRPAARGGGPARPPPARRRVRRAGGPRAVDRGAGGRAVRRAGTPRAVTPRTGAAPPRPRRPGRRALGPPPRRGGRGGHARLRVLRGPPARRTASGRHPETAGLRESRAHADPTA